MYPYLVFFGFKGYCGAELLRVAGVACGPDKATVKHVNGVIYAGRCVGVQVQSIESAIG